MCAYVCVIYEVQNYLAHNILNWGAATEIRVIFRQTNKRIPNLHLHSTRARDCSSTMARAWNQRADRDADVVAS